MVSADLRMITTQNEHGEFALVVEYALNGRRKVLGLSFAEARAVIAQVNAVMRQTEPDGHAMRLTEEEMKAAGHAANN